MSGWARGGEGAAARHRVATKHRENFLFFLSSYGCRFRQPQLKKKIQKLPHVAARSPPPPRAPDMIHSFA